MSNFWVVDTKCKVLPESVLPQDGSAYYYGRSVVPADAKEDAVAQLTQVLEENGILVDSVLAAVIYEDGQWEDDAFEVHESFEESEDTGRIALGFFMSEKQL
jgi:hypothetical protein